jgi:RNA polymerase sigma-70 factor (ECF subfamily)
LEGGVLFYCVRGEENMQATEAVGCEPHTNVSIRENGVRELQDVLSRYLPRFYRGAYRQLGNAADAEDAVQDALLAAYKHLDQFKGQAQMSTWLTTIVTNCARMQLRRRPRQPHISLDEPSGEDQEYCLSDRLADSGLNPEDQCRNAELRRRLLQSVAQLSPSLRRVFELRDLDGRSVREAAHTLGLAEGTVKAQLSRARAKLTRLMRHALRPERHSVLVRTSSSVDRGTQLEQVPATICRTLHHMMMRTATVTPATDRQDWSEAAVKRETRSRTAI